MKYTITSLILGSGPTFGIDDDVKRFANYCQFGDSTRIILYHVNYKHVTDYKNVKIKLFHHTV